MMGRVVWIAFCIVLFGSKIWAQPDRLLLYPGRFYPPTLEHMSLLIRVMESQKFQRAKILISRPYKAYEIAEDGDISKSLTELAVENLDEVLRGMNLPFSSFERLSAGRCRFVVHGKTYEIDVDSTELSSKTATAFASRLETLERLKSDQVYWLAGAESFAGLQVFGEKWIEVLDYAHFIVVPRHGAQDVTTPVDFKTEDPLSKILPSSIRHRYEYSSKPKKFEHDYVARDSHEKSIHLRYEPASAQGSYLVRHASEVKSPADLAPNLLQPTVFREIVRQGYFCDRKPVEGVQNPFLNSANLQVLLSDLRQKIQRKDARPEDIAAYDQMSQAAIKLAIEAANEEEAKGRFRRFVSGFYSHLVEPIMELREMGSFRKIKQKLNDLSKKFGAKNLAIALILGNVFELTLQPLILNAIGGPEAMALVPLIHVEPAIFFVWWLLQRADRRREMRSLAGSVEEFKVLDDYRIRLHRADPDILVSTLTFGMEFGVSKEPLEINIVKSKLPSFIPLFIRNWFEKDSHWYDLNLSVNELKAILSNRFLANSLWEQAGEEVGPYADLLMQAIWQDPDAKVRFRLFMHRRNWIQLAFRMVPREMLDGFSANLRERVAELQRARGQIEERLDPLDMQSLASVMSMVFAVRAELAADPNLLHRADFKNEIRERLVHAYPSVKKKIIWSRARRERIQFEFALFEQMILRSHPDYTPIGEWRDFGFRESRLKNAAIDYLKIIEDSLPVVARDAALDFVRPKPILDRNPESYNNLLWEYGKTFANIRLRFDDVRQSIEKKLQRIELYPHHKRAPAFFEELLAGVDRDLKKDFEQARAVHFEWLKARSLADSSGLVDFDEKTVATYSSTRQAYDQIKARMKMRVKLLLEIHQYLLTGDADRFEDLEKLRTHFSKVETSAHIAHLGDSIPQKCVHWLRQTGESLRAQLSLGFR